MEKIGTSAERTERIVLRLEDVAADVANNSRFGVIKRQTCPEYDVNNMLQAIDVAGRERTDRFTLDKENLFTYTNLVKWVMNDPSMLAIDPRTGKAVKGDLKRGIFIGGSTGSGKSWALELGSYLAKITGRQWQTGGVKHLLSWPNVRAVDLSVAFSRSGEIDRWYSEDIMGIQDLGSEPEESVYMGNRMDVLRQLIEQRGDCSGKLTLITSNLTYDEIAERYGDRVASRLYGMCNYFHIVGKDRRML